MVDLHPSDHVRLEVAFSTMPDDPSPAWQDLTSRLDLSAGISRTYGAQDEFSQPQPATATVSVDNRDGALTPGNVASPFYPNVRPQRRLRLSYRDPATGGNLLTASAASMESSIADWSSSSAFGSLDVATLAQSALHPQDGTQGGRATWPTTVIGSMAMTFVSGMVIGRTYTASAYVWVPAGSPDVKMECLFVASGSLTSTKNTMTRISVTFTATSTGHFIGPRCLTATAGQLCFWDAVQVEEGTSASTFTLSAPQVQYLFTGHVEEWPTEWPGGQLYSQTVITATDRFARIGQRRAMRSVIEEAVLAADPSPYFPLGEPEGSVLAGDVSGTVSVTPLSIAQVGAGGTLDFGTSTGPPTDALPAPTFTPSGANGKYLSGTGLSLGGLSSLSLRAAFLTSVAAKATTVRLRDGFGTYLQLEVTAAGRIRANLFNPFTAADMFTVTSGATVSDGGTHDAVVTVSLSGGTATVVLYLDGANVGSTSYSATYLPLLSAITVGGHSGGDLFTGTISHVAAFPTALTAAQVTEQNTAVTTGFAGERSDQRIARYAAWAGFPADYWTNLVANPSFEVNTTGWSASGAGTTFDRVGSISLVGGNAGRILTGSGSTSGASYNAAPVTVGTSYGARVAVYPGTTSDIRVTLQWRDGGGVVLSAVSQDFNGLASGAWATVWMTGTAPATAATVYVYVQRVNSSTVGVTVLLDAVLLRALSPTETFDPSVYFDTTKYPTLDVGSSTSIAFTDTTGQSVLSAMQDVAQTEGGRLFVNGAGDIVFHARSRKYANPSAVASVSARMLTGAERFTLSTQGLVNDLTGQRPDGPLIRAYDAASIAEFGTFNSSLTLLVTADNEVADAVNWRVSTSGQPDVRLPQGTFDLYTDASTAAALRPVELGDRFTITDLPAQAPASSLDFVLEGYTETIGIAGWSRTANLTNYADVQGLTLDDNVYGLLDGDNRLVY